MHQPKVPARTWITISNGISAYVFNLPSYGLSVGYLQHGGKAIKDDVMWDGERWQFCHSAPSGSYLYGQDERIVKKGPHRPTCPAPR